MSSLPRGTLTRILKVAEDAESRAGAANVSLAEFLARHTELPALWAALVEADRMHASMRVAALVRQILELDVSTWRATVQTLELLFRTAPMYTWLIARPSGQPTPADGGAYAQPANGIRIAVLDVEQNAAKYQLHVACYASTLKSIMRLLGESKTYATNFDRLRFVGFSTVLGQ